MPVPKAAGDERLEPMAAVGLPALPSDERDDPDAVADADAPAYDALADA